MHADLVLLYRLYLWIMIIIKKKSWAKFSAAGQSITIFFKGLH